MYLYIYIYVYLYIRRHGCYCNRESWTLWQLTILFSNGPVVLSSGVSFWLWWLFIWRFLRHISWKWMNMASMGSYECYFEAQILGEHSSSNRNRSGGRFEQDLDDIQCLRCAKFEDLTGHQQRHKEVDICWYDIYKVHTKIITVFDCQEISSLDINKTVFD